jgi:hypothetical protein
MKTHSILKKIIRMAYGAIAVNMQISQLTDEISQLQERLTSKKQQLVELEDARSRYVDQVRRDYSYYYQYCNGVDASDNDYSSDESDYGYSSDDDVWQCPTCRTCIRAYCHCNDQKDKRSQAQRFARLHARWEKLLVPFLRSSSTR